jgi:phosphoribosylcarboxyaminoimidazole (NCAIR) mutase
MKRKISSKETCHRTGDKVVATGTEGADGVCVLIIYCSGAAYLPGNFIASTTFSTETISTNSFAR